MLAATIEATARVAGPEESVAHPADLTSDQPKENHHVSSKTPTYKFLPNSGLQKIAHYIRELGGNIFREVIHPPSGGGTELAVIADESFCLGQHVTIFDNLVAAVRNTHTCDRDMIVVIRNATLEDMADTLENMMEKWKNVTVSGPGGSQASIGFFPGTVVVAYSAKRLLSNKC